jgi:histidinol-phosphate aminotransferase
MTTVKLVKKYKNLIVLRSFSKIFGMAGARLGYAVACPEIINSLKKVKPTFDVNGLAVKLAIGIMDNPKIIKTLVKNAKEGKDYLCKQLSKERIEYKAGQANFILIKCYGRFSQITKKLAKKGILVNSGFEHPFLHDCIRVTTGDIKHMRYFWNAFVKIWRSN